MRNRLLVLAVIAAWFLCPLPQPPAIKTIEIKREGLPSFTVIDQTFVCVRRSDEILLRAIPQLSRGSLQIDVLDPNGGTLAGPLALSGDKSDHWTFVTNGGFRKGQNFRLRCTESGVLGGYRLLISQPWTITLGQRFVAALAVLTAVLLVTVILRLFHIGGDRVRRLRVRLTWSLFLAIFWLVYPVVHEGGHILALLAFHAWEPSGTSLLPVGGQLPHASATPSAHLAPWQMAVVAASGPVLPTLLGYASFALWSSPRGRRWRTHRLGTDITWSFLIVVLLVPQAVPVPVLFPRAVPDTDFTLFMDNAGIPLWAVQAIAAVVALVNLAIVVWVLRHLVLRMRATRRRTEAAQ